MLINIQWARQAFCYREWEKWMVHAVKNVKNKNFQHTRVSFRLMRGSSRSQKSFCLIHNLEKVFLTTQNVHLKHISPYLFLTPIIFHVHSLSRNVWALLECLCIIQGNVRRYVVCSYFPPLLGYKMIHSRGKNYFTWDAWMFYEKKFPAASEWWKIVINPAKLRNYVTSDNCIY